MCWIKKLYSGFEVVFGTWTSNGLQLQLDQILSLESLTEVKKSRGRRHAPLFRLYVIIDNFCVFWLLTNSFASFPLILFMFVEFLHFSSHFSVLSMYFTMSRFQVLIRKCMKDPNPFIHVTSSRYDQELFLVVWGPTVAALSYVYDNSNDKANIQKTMQGFR